MENYIGVGGKKEQEYESEYEIDEINFDHEQYKKDIAELNELTARILKNNPPCVKGTRLEPDCSTTEIDTKKVPCEAEQDIWKQFDGEKFVFDQDRQKKNSDFQKSIDGVMKNKKPVNFFGSEWVGYKLSDDIIEKSKETLNDVLPPVAKDLKNLGLYGVYAISDNKFDATYMDFVESEKEEIDTERIVKIPSDMQYQRSQPFMNKYNDVGEYLKLKPMETLELKLFSSVGRMKEVFIPLTDARIEIGIKDYINDKFLIKVKELASKNIDNKLTNNIKKDIIVGDNKKDDYTKVCNKLTMVSNYVQMKNRIGKPTFVLASKNNINYINEALSGYWSRDGKTYKYNKLTENFNYNLIANNDMGDTVIMGRVPKEGEVGINLVINKKTLTNFEYSDDDITGINLSFDFFAFGNHPEWNYFSFDMKR